MQATRSVPNVPGDRRGALRDLAGRMLLRRFWSTLPRGSSLSDDVWRHRHVGILVLLWLHVPGIVVVALVSGHTLAHGLVEAGFVAAFATLAAAQSRHRRVAAALASLGLLTASAILVHLSNGSIETHFHFFVVISVVTLYQDWVPFLLAIGMVATHHGLMGVLDPGSVYNHGDAVLHPWKWAAIHGAFVVAASAASIINWRLAERLGAHQQSAQAETQALLTATAQLGAQDEPEAVLRTLVEHATELLQAERAFYALEREGDDLRYAAWQKRTWVIPNSSLSLSDSVIGRVWRTGRAYRSNGTADELSLGRDSLVRFAARSLLSAPLLDQDGKTIGLVTLVNSQRSGGFNAHDEALLLGFCGYASASFRRVHDAVARRSAEERYRRIVETAQEGICTIDTQDNLTFVNQKMADMLGYPVVELLGGPLFAFLGEAGQALMAPKPALRKGDAERHELEFRHKDLTSLWALFQTSPLLDGDGRYAGALAMVTDITERRRAEDEIRSLNERLEHRVRERTQELEIAKAEAERANQAKSEFLSRMSHELRTPLNAILGFAQVMELDERNEEDCEALQLILAGGRHLLELINEVLDIARIEAGEFSMSTEPVGIRRVAAEAIALIRPMAAERGVKIAAPNELPNADCDHFVLADQQRLKQVFLNLLSNAVKYNHPGGHVNVTFEERPSRQLRTTIADDGPGISEDLLDRLFSPFDRLGAEQTGVEGTGLGLALSKRLVEAMQGNIAAESSPGRGSSFWLELPLADEQLNLSAMGDTSATTSNLAIPAGTRVVLYVEDNLSNFKLVERVLAHRPRLSLLPAMLGGLGLELAREHQPDLILLDVHLPDIAGDEVLRRLRGDPRTCTIPVIVISADATPQQIERILGAGATAYLTKPLQVGQFLETLDTTLEPRVGAA